MRTETRLLLILAVVISMGCKSWRDSIDTKMIARDAYSEKVGMNQMLRDVEACGQHSASERLRLKAELYGDDSYFAAQDRRVATGKVVGKEIGKEMAEPSPGPGMPTTRQASGKLNTERMAGDAGALAGGFIIDVITSDSDKHDQKMLAMDLDNVHTFVRFKNICLRQKGYQVPEYEADGTGTAHLLAEPLRVVIRAEDGREVVMYQQPETEGE